MAVRKLPTRTEQEGAQSRDNGDESLMNFLLVLNREGMKEGAREVGRGSDQWDLREVRPAQWQVIKPCQETSIKVSVLHK